MYKAMFNWLSDERITSLIKISFQFNKDALTSHSHSPFSPLLFSKIVVNTKSKEQIEKKDQSNLQASSSDTIAFIHWGSLSFQNKTSSNNNLLPRDKSFLSCLFLPFFVFIENHECEKMFHSITLMGFFLFWLELEVDESFVQNFFKSVRKETFLMM